MEPVPSYYILFFQEEKKGFITYLFAMNMTFMVELNLTILRLFIHRTLNRTFYTNQ